MVLTSRSRRNLVYHLVGIQPNEGSCKGPSGTLKSQALQGSIYPTGTRFHIPDFSLISGSPGDKASTWSRGPVTRVTCQGNQA